MNQVLLTLPSQYSITAAGQESLPSELNKPGAIDSAESAQQEPFEVVIKLLSESGSVVNAEAFCTGPQEIVIDLVTETRQLQLVSSTVHPTDPFQVASTEATKSAKPVTLEKPKVCNIHK